MTLQKVYVLKNESALQLHENISVVKMIPHEFGSLLIRNVTNKKMLHG